MGGGRRHAYTSTSYLTFISLGNVHNLGFLGNLGSVPWFRNKFPVRQNFGIENTNVEDARGSVRLCYMYLGTVACTQGL